MYRQLASLIAVFAVGCGGADAPAPSEPMELLDVFGLTPVEAADDPFVDHRPDDVDCPVATWGPEAGGFEIETGACAYAAFDQPLPSGVTVGDTVAITVWHDLLDAPEPATAHLAVWIGAKTLWETRIGIPTPSALVEAAAPILETPPPGARLGVHLHNHGFNSWRIISIELVPGLAD